MSTRTLACSLALAGLLAASPLAQAQDADARGGHPYSWLHSDHAKGLPINPEQLGQFSSSFQPGAYYVGLSLRPAGETLRSHLRLDEKQGLVVISVAVDSSAANAGLERHDVLTEIDGVQITGQQMLVDVLQEAGKKDREVELSFIRAGEHDQVSLKPMKRENFQPRGDAASQPFKLGPEQIERLPREFREFFRNQGNQDVQMQLDDLRREIEELKQLMKEPADK